MFGDDHEREEGPGRKERIYRLGWRMREGKDWEEIGTGYLVGEGKVKGETEKDRK